MNNRIILLSFLLSLFLYSCCYKGSYSTAGLPRREIKPFDKRNADAINIDTLAVYKWEISFGGNPKFYERQLHRDYQFTAYLKFYPNNKLGLFVIDKADTLNLTREHFNPQKAKMGYYYVDGNNLTTKISSIMQCQFAVTKIQGRIIGDTIIQEYQNSGTIYVKKNISKDLIKNWRPDW